MATKVKYKRLMIWAEKGFVRMEDQDTGEFITITRRDALLRAKAINDGLVDKWPSERVEGQRLVSGLIDVIKEAKVQGDPMDPVVMEEMIREVNRSKRAGSGNIILPSGSVPGVEIKPMSSFRPPPTKLEIPLE